MGMPRASCRKAALPGAERIVALGMSDAGSGVPSPRTPRAETRVGGGGAPSQSPLYDALVREWLDQGREVPRAPAPRSRWERVDPQDLFHRG
ncbi:hypothetical protein GCM10010277_02670 [Streptomyces longisporoflavus]|nr:hypothetical protein GCM10010277_02670 [Streptomyces longisporoflavus]